MAKELKGWISGIRISGDLTVNTYRDDTVNPPVNTLRAVANGNTSEISWYDGATPDVKGFMKNFAPPYYPDETYVPGDIRTNDLNIYVCETATTGPFNPVDWSAPINVQDLLQVVSPKEVFIGDDEPADSEVLWIDTNEDYSEAEVFVRYDAAQSLTPAQKNIVKENIGIEDELNIQPDDPHKGKVWIDTDEDYSEAEVFIRYDAVQSLTQPQKDIAKGNIGVEDEVYVRTEDPHEGKIWIDPNEDYPENDIFLRYDAAQTLTSEQKNIVKKNIGTEDEVSIQAEAPHEGKLWVDIDEDAGDTELWQNLIDNINQIKADIIAIKNFIHMV